MRMLAVVLLLSSVLIGAPASAADPVSQPCSAEQVAAADLVLDADGTKATIPTPTLPSPYPLGVGGEPDPLGMQAQATDVYTVLVDLNPDFASTAFSVGITWEHTGDIDMDVYVGAAVKESHSFNPLDGNAEAIDGGRIKHCQTFDVHIRNYIAGPGDIALTLGTSSLRTT